jgi:hypothetical protein
VMGGKEGQVGPLHGPHATEGKEGQAGPARIWGYNEPTALHMHRHEMQQIIIPLNK